MRMIDPLLSRPVVLLSRLVLAYPPMFAYWRLGVLMLLRNAGTSR